LATALGQGLIAVVLAGCTTVPLAQAPTPLGPAAAASPPPAAPAPRFAADIRRTAYGVPHITAKDMGGLGYGYGYASAEDNLCEIMDRYMTVRAERARHLGPGENDANIASDLYHQRLIDQGETETLLNGPASSVDTPTAEARAMAQGYVAGVNRYLAETGAGGLTDPRCRGRSWVKPLTEVEFWRHMFMGQTVDGFFGPTTSAQPPVPGQRAQRAPDPAVIERDYGSNAYAIGREATKAGRGAVFGNPHYPWDGPNRFYRAHFMIPGELNVVGVSYIGMPLIRMGHTDRIAWSNTVSTARRFGYFELQLDPADPTRYLYEGQYEPMTRQTVTVQVKRGDALVPETRVLFASRHGPVVSSETFPWSRTTAYSLRTVRVGLRDVDQYMSVWRAKSVRELSAALGQRQAYRFNTTAADADGEVFYGDTGMIPRVTRELIAQCALSDTARKQWTENRMSVLDGSRAACAWGTDADATAPGVFGPAASPRLFRSDWVMQSNDSYWLTNPAQPLVGFSPVWGDEDAQRSLRTRLAIDQVEKRLAGTDGFGPPKFDMTSFQQILYANRHLGAELVRDDLVGLCRKSGRARLQPACDALAAWDLRVNADSRGAHLFHLFAEAGGLRFRTPFNPASPLRTPHTLDVSDRRVLAALESAVATLQSNSLPIDAPLGAVQRETRNGERIPIHGGAGPEGVFNVISVESLEPDFGWTSIRHGASWIMTVEFTDQGPRSQGILTYSQSTNSASPHFSDQTRLYARKGWDDLRFTEAEVAGATISRKSIAE
jgi:acyl-homoserine-lactone acylase